MIIIEILCSWKWTSWRNETLLCPILIKLTKIGMIAECDLLHLLLLWELALGVGIRQAIHSRVKLATFLLRIPQIILRQCNIMHAARSELIIFQLSIWRFLLECVEMFFAVAQSNGSWLLWRLIIIVRSPQIADFSYRSFGLIRLGLDVILQYPAHALLISFQDMPFVILLKLPFVHLVEI